MLKILIPVYFYSLMLSHACDYDSVDIYSIQYRIQSAIAISPETLIRRPDAVHTVLSDSSEILKLCYRLDRAISFPPEYKDLKPDARIVCLLHSRCGRTDTLSIGAMYMHLNQQAPLFADSTLMRSIAQYLPSKHAKEIDLYIQDDLRVVRVHD